MKADESFCTTPGSAGCYNGVITLSNAANTFYYRSGAQAGGTFDFFTVAEHEIDEILGTPSCLTALSGSPAISAGCTNGGTGV